MQALFDVDAFVFLAEFVLLDPRLQSKLPQLQAEVPQLQPAMQPSGTDGERLEALFWDVHGLTCRGIEGVAADRFEEFFPDRQQASWGLYSNARQLPPLFNIAKLAAHVERERHGQGGVDALSVGLARLVAM